MDFNPENFLNTEVQGIGETEYTAVPEGEYQAVIKSVIADLAGDKPILRASWIIDSAEVRELMGQDEPICTQTFWLDLNENGTLAFGKNKNIKLNQCRSALGQNTGSPWKPSDMVGQPATVMVRHELRDDGRTFAKVVDVRA